VFYLLSANILLTFSMQIELDEAKNELERTVAELESLKETAAASQAELERDIAEKDTKVSLLMLELEEAKRFTFYRRPSCASSEYSIGVESGIITPPQFAFYDQEVNALKAKIILLEKENANLTHEVEGLNSDYQGLQEQHQSLNNKRKANREYWQQRVDQAEDQRREALLEVEEMRESVAPLHKELSALRRQMQSDLQEIQSRAEEAEEACRLAAETIKSQKIQLDAASLALANAEVVTLARFKESRVEMKETLAMAAEDDLAMRLKLKLMQESLQATSATLKESESNFVIEGVATKQRQDLLLVEVEEFDLQRLAEIEALKDSLRLSEERAELAREEAERLRDELENVQDSLCDVSLHLDEETQKVEEQKTLNQQLQGLLDRVDGELGSTQSFIVASEEEILGLMNEHEIRVSELQEQLDASRQMLDMAEEDRAVLVRRIGDAMQATDDAQTECDAAMSRLKEVSPFVSLCLIY
jgi:chromosome segregation ATPase